LYSLKNLKIVLIEDRNIDLLEAANAAFIENDEFDSETLTEAAISPEEKARRDRVFEEELLPQIDALYTFAFHLTYSEADADDLVQEAYLKAYRFIDKYEPNTNPKAWLFRILKNSFINHYRKKAKQPHKVDLEDFITFHDSDDTASLAGYSDLRQDMFEAMMGDEVTLAINRLSVEFRTVILLCDVEGFTYEEISKIVDIPIGTVRSRLHRARNMLKEQLAEYAASMGFKDKRNH
jgi:RNA polymerase sigma-70 factor (ECF subfamily)